MQLSACTRHCAKHLALIISQSSPQKGKAGTIIIPVLLMRNWGSEGFSNLPKFMQRIGGESSI